MNIEEKIRNENKEISKSILRIMKDIKTNYGEKGKTNLEEFKINPKEKYNPDDLFKRKNSSEIVNENNQNNIEETALTEYKENFFTKVKNFILQLLHLKN